MQDFKVKEASISWYDHENYWHAPVTQGTLLWKSLRWGRCTGTTADGINYYGQSKEQVAQTITGEVEPTFSSAAWDRITFGTKNEPVARDWYSRRYQIKVMEMGFCVPKFDPHLGASVDGKIVDENGIIEIKCPQYMYWDLEEFMETQTIKSDFSHIKKDHYRQMQFNMACLRADFCDYIVYPKYGSKIFVQRIPFNYSYWKSLLERTQEFWKSYVYPRLVSKKIPYPYLPKNGKIIDI